MKRKLTGIILCAVIVIMVMTGCGVKTTGITIDIDSDTKVQMQIRDSTDFICETTGSGTFVFYEKADNNRGEMVAEGVILDASVEGWNMLMNELQEADAHVIERGVRNKADYFYAQIPGYQMSYGCFTKIPKSDFGYAIYAQSKETINKALAAVYDIDVK